MASRARQSHKHRYLQEHRLCLRGRTRGAEYGPRMGRLADYLRHEGLSFDPDGFMVADWIKYLREEKAWGPEDPMFPASDTSLDQAGRYSVRGLKRQNWRTAAPIRSIFRKAFAAAGIAYFHPHSFRKTLVAFGLSRCGTPEDFKAWSQNLGHDGVMTTFTSYCAVQVTRQAEIMRELAGREALRGAVTDDLLDEI